MQARMGFMIMDGEIVYELKLISYRSSYKLRLYVLFNLINDSCKYFVLCNKRHPHLFKFYVERYNKFANMHDFAIIC